MDYKQREEAARQIEASVREAIGRIMSDRNAGHQIVRAPGTGSPRPDGSDTAPKH